MSIENRIDQYIDEEFASKQIYQLLKNFDKFNMDFKKKVTQFKKQLQKVKGTEKTQELLDMSYKYYDNANKEFNSFF